MQSVKIFFEIRLYIYIEIVAPMPLVTSISKNMRRNAPLLLKANRRKLLVIFIKKIWKNKWNDSEKAKN